MEFRRLHEDFGAQVLDFDVLDGRAAQDIQELQCALDEHQLLLFRSGQRISPERQIEMMGWFGPVVDDAGDGKGWTVLRNDEPSGSRRLPFHADFTYTDSPIKGISLHAIELPPSGTSTSYASGIAAWARLPRAMQDRLTDLSVRHSYVSTFPDWPEFVADHPVRFVHPRSGAPILFITEYHAERIRELDRETSDRILRQLLDHLYAPERIYVHHWQLYDLVLWDNLAVQHARCDTADPANGNRAMQRVALNDVTLTELIARARERQAHSQLQGT